MIQPDGPCQFNFLPLHRGRLGLSACPGWSRSPATLDLEAEVRAIADWPAAAVVSLMEDSEFRRLGLGDLPVLLKRQIPLWMHLPIRDHDIPDARWMARWPEAHRTITGILADGGNVLIHCLGGLGLTGTVAALLVMEAEGCDGDEAIGRVREAHSVHALETPEQREFVRNYRVE